jgi:hypothetical protein
MCSKIDSSSHPCLPAFSTIFWEFFPIYSTTKFSLTIFINLEINFRIEFLFLNLSPDGVAIWPIYFRASPASPPAHPLPPHFSPFSFLRPSQAAAVDVSRTGRPRATTRVQLPAAASSPPLEPMRPHRGHSVAVAAWPSRYHPSSGETQNGFPVCPPLPPLGRLPWAPERQEAKLWRAWAARPWPIHRGSGIWWSTVSLFQNSLWISKRASGLVVGSGSGQPTHPSPTPNQGIPMVSCHTHTPKPSGMGENLYI